MKVLLNSDVLHHPLELDSADLEDSVAHRAARAGGTSAIVAVSG
jgi:hypothetical protein